MLDFIKIILLILLVLIIIVDIPIYNFLKNPQYQFLIALTILTILLFVDTGIGFIMAIIMFIIYFKVYTKIINKNSKETMNNMIDKSNSNKSENINNISVSNINTKLYISPEHLVAVQNNIFDVNSYNTEIKGFNKGYNNENVYSAQGFDIEKNYVSGFDENFYLNYSLDNYFSKLF